MAESPLEVPALQREFFRILEEFFERATGYRVSEFAALGEFDEVIRTNAERIGSRSPEAFEWMENSIRPYYGRRAMGSFSGAKHLGGMKLVLGGQSRFLETQLNSVRKMALYSDTILIPDPVLPWLEEERAEERFRHVLLLQNVFWILHLKPLADAELAYPAIVVFPSWERSLERNDQQTQSMQQAFFAQFFSHQLKQEFDDISDIVDYVRKREADFLRAVDAAQLFLAPGAEKPEPLADAINRYENDLITWRSDEANKTLLSLPKGLLVLNGLLERLSPQYHLLENSEELLAQPMLCLDAHWHYYTRIASMHEERLVKNGTLSPASSATLRALNQPSLRWLGNIPINALAELRRNNENEAFRRKLDEHVKALHSAALEDLDRVAAEVGRGISSLLADHQKQIRKIEEDYKIIHSQTAVASWLTLAATLIPTFAPFLAPTAPILLASKYVFDKKKELLERRRAARSLTGVLASACDIEK